MDEFSMFHVNFIEKALGIEAVSSVEFPWYFRAKTPQENGVQVDLLVERADRSYSMCQIKFNGKEFVIGKRYAEVLRRKKQALQQHGKRGYTIFLVMITTFGVRRNDNANELSAVCVRTCTGSGRLLRLPRKRYGNSSGVA